MKKFNCHIFEISDSISEFVENGATVPIYVSGSSMNPFLISRRDIVWLSGFEHSDLKTGKIVLCRRIDGSMVLHRIVKILPEGRLVVRGDAQTWTEEIYIEQIVAVVSDIQRKDRKRSANSYYWRIIDTLWRALIPFRSIIMRAWFKIKRMKTN